MRVVYTVCIQFKKAKSAKSGGCFEITSTPLAYDF